MVNLRGVSSLQVGFSCAEGDSYGQAWIFIPRGSKQVTVRIQQPHPIVMQWASSARDLPAPRSGSRAKLTICAA